LIEEYEQKLGNGLPIKRSGRNSFHLYVCKEHDVDCKFQICVGRRRVDGMFLVKRVIPNHTGDRWQALAVDGRRHKKRRAQKLDKMIVKVRNAKKEHPTPADVIRTAATHSVVFISYMAAWRALHCETSARSRAQRKNFELIVPYIDELKKQNPGSVIECGRDDEMRITEICVFPGFMNNSLRNV
jgi:hypothetical protein